MVDQTAVDKAKQTAVDKAKQAADDAAKRVKESDVAKSDIVTVDLHNPTEAPRVVYDGIGKNPKSILVQPGETKHNVVVHKDLADELKRRTKPRGKEKSDLHVLPAGSKDPAPADASSGDPDADDAK